MESHASSSVASELVVGVIGSATDITSGQHAARGIAADLVGCAIGDATDVTLEEFMSQGVGRRRDTPRVDTAVGGASTVGRYPVDDVGIATSAPAGVPWLELLSSMASSPLVGFVASVDTAGSLVRDILLGSALYTPAAREIATAIITAATDGRLLLAVEALQRWARDQAIPRQGLRLQRAAAVSHAAVAASNARQQERAAAAASIAAFCCTRHAAKVERRRTSALRLATAVQASAVSWRQERLAAVAVLRRFATSIIAKAAASARRRHVTADNCSLVRGEAVLTLQQLFRKLGARMCVSRLRQARAQQMQQRVLAGAATVIQAGWRGVQGRLSAAAMRAQRVFQAARTIQSAFRGKRSRTDAEQRRKVREALAVRQRLTDVVVRLQSFCRMILYANKRRRASAGRTLRATLRRFTAGYSVRRALAVAHTRDVAARRIQRAARRMLAVSRTAMARANHRRIQRQNSLDFAARCIQCRWRIVVAKHRCAARRVEVSAAHVAATVIQRFSAIPRCRALRRRLAATQSIERECRCIARAALLLTSVARGFLARRRHSTHQRTIRNAVGLIQRVVAGYQARRFTRAATVVYKRHLSAAVIQSKWSNVQAIRRRDACRAHKLNILEGWRRKHFAAVLVQAQARRWACQFRYRQLRRVLHYAASKIQTRFRMVLAKRTLQRLAHAHWLAQQALRIQRAWLRVRIRFRQRRLIRDLEASVVRMDWKALVRAQAAMRFAIAEDENDLYVRNLQAFHVVLVALSLDYERRLAFWRKLNPPQLRVSAATRVQSFFRGYKTRCRLDAERQARRLDAAPAERAITELLDVNEGRLQPADTESTHDSSAGSSNIHSGSVVRDVALGLRLLRQLSAAAAERHVDDAPLPLSSRGHSSGKSAALADGAVESASSWLGWMLQFPELRSRQCERLLQREHAGRRKLWDEFTVSSGSFALHLQSVHALRRANNPRGLVTLAPVAEAPALVVARARRDQQAIAAAAAAHRVFLPPIIEQRSAALGAPAVFSAAYVTAAINGSPTVDVSNMGVTHIELQTLVERILANADTIETLLLDGNRLNDMACADIAAVLVHSTRLRVLSLRHNHITDVGISHIIAAASRSPSLEVLDVAGTLVTERYRSHILRLLAAPRTTLGLSNVRRTGVSSGVNDELPLVTARTIAPPPSIAHLAPSRAAAAVDPPYRLMKVEVVYYTREQALEEAVAEAEGFERIQPFVQTAE